MDGTNLQDRDGITRLRILATSDLHSHIFPWDYLADQPSPNRGLAPIATLIAQARAERSCCILLDNGDFVQGSPLGDLIAAKDRPDTPHPIVAAMNHLGYDAVTLGNHEFSHGLPFLTRTMRDLACPVVSANILHAPTGAAFTNPFVILDRQVVLGTEAVTLRIGVIGFAPPQLEQWDHQHVAGHIVTEDILTAAQREVRNLRALGADLVIALSHSGIGAAAAHPGMENASTALAAQDGIDVVITGHTHQAFPSPGFPASEAIDPARGTLHGKPAVMPGFFGSHLGVIDLDLARQADGWCIVAQTSALWPIAVRHADGQVQPLVASDPAIEALAARAHDDTLAWARRRIGRNTKALHSYFALIRACPSVEIVARAQAAFLRTALAGTRHADLPILSAAAPFRAGGRGGPEHYSFVAAGDLAMRHVSDLYMHPNTLTAIEISATELADWLEHGASIFRRIIPGAADQTLIDPDFPSFNFDSTSGVTYRIDLSQPPRRDARGCVVNPTARRITDLRYAGLPVRPDMRFVVATNSYRTGGSGDFTAARPDRVIHASGRLSSDVLHDFIVAQGGIPEPAAGPWRFAAMPGTSVIFNSAPAAADHLSDIADLAVEPLDLTPDGFRRFRLHL